MRKSMILMCVATGLAGCGQGSDTVRTDNAAANSAAAASQPKPAYCFFKDSETKGWTAKRGKDGNVMVTGKAYREDSRYKAVLAPATITGSTAQIAPTITGNDTGYGAEDNWWDLSATIPNSAGVSTVNVTCGAKNVATLQIAPKA